MTTRPETQGMLLGLLGVTIFSLTLPATRAAVAFFDAFFVAAGRAVVLVALGRKMPVRRVKPTLTSCAK